MKKAKKAWFAIQYYLKPSKNKKIATYLYLFDTQVKPILLYPCGSWVDSLKNNGNLSDTIQKNAIARFHIGVLKQFLGVHKKTTNVAMLLETGRHPITISAQVQAIKYFFRFPIIKHDKLLKSYYEKEKLYSVRNDKFIKYIINTLDNIGMGNIWKEQLIENKDLSKDATLVKCIKTRLTDISSQSLISSLKNNSGKLTFLTKIKDTHKFEEYLNIDNFEHRRAISKLRTSSHKLEIETGRWNNIQKEDRMCKNCALGAVEDEFHMLFDCRMHVTERTKFFNSLKYKIGIPIQGHFHQNPELMIKETFNSKNISALNALGNFIKTGFENRENITCHIFPPQYVCYQRNLQD